MIFETLCPEKYLGDLKLFTEALALSIQETFEVIGHIVRELPLLLGNHPRITHTHKSVYSDRSSTARG